MSSITVAHAPMPVTARDESPVDLLRRHIADQVRGYLRLVLKNEADFDATTYYHHVAVASEMLALLDEVRCRCGRVVTTTRDGVEVCAPCAVHTHAAPVGDSIQEKRAVLRAVVAELSDELFDEMQGRGIWHDLINACVQPRPVDEDEVVPVCEVCGGADGHDPRCAVAALDRLVRS